MWQKCPVCNGSGRTHNTLSSSSFDICSTCNGTKIISQVNGLPPNYEQNKTKHPSTDFRDGNMESQQEYFGK